MTILAAALALFTPMAPSVGAPTLVPAAGVPAEFYDYLKRPDASFKYEVKRTPQGGMDMPFTSQIWQGIEWKHSVVLQRPATEPDHDVAVLFITGDRRDRDVEQLRFITAATGLPVAILFDIPNQPIYGMKEDDLIAHTFERYLATGDATWPLLFPMAKSAIRAMDVVVAATKDSPRSIRRFVVTGASKRGWTTWFVGAARDKRVLGIAPMVIDTLNTAAQMKHQIDSWGKYSEQIEDYTRRGLQQKLESPEGQKLAQIIDPFTYRQNIRIPTLIVNGANDQYWTVDALSIYWDALKMPKNALIVPNAGHDLGGGFKAMETIGAFARSLAGDGTMPEFRGKITSSSARESGTMRTVMVEGRSKWIGHRTLTVWAATSDDLDFRPKRYQPLGTVEIDGSQVGGLTSVVSVLVPRDKNVAVLAEARYRVGGREFSLSLPVRVFPKVP